MNIILLVVTTLIGYIVGKIVALFKLPEILGWLISGMVFGPYLLGFVTHEDMSSNSYHLIIEFSSFFVGVLFASHMSSSPKDSTEKTQGRKIVLVAIIESTGTFIIVSSLFLVALYIIKLPLYLAFVFGGIALATAPAPSLAIINQYKTNGPLTKTLIPVALIDDGIGVIIFSIVMVSITTMFGVSSTESIPFTLSLIGKLSPYFIGISLSLCFGKIIQNLGKIGYIGLLMFFMSIIGLIYISDMLLLTEMTANYMIIGFVVTFILKKTIKVQSFEKALKTISPILLISILIMILDLGMELNYKLISSAGFFTILYIISRGTGKILSANIATKALGFSPSVSKYLGLTLLPHTGVSLVFTGLAISTLLPISPDSVMLLQGTIAGAAIINEVIAVFLAKKAFVWAREIPAQ